MRVKGGATTRQRRKATIRKVEGAWGFKKSSYKIARQTLIRSSEYAYRDRKARKRDFRKLWNTRINSAVRELGYNYSTFINALKKAKVALNRKMISELAISQPNEFKSLVEKIMKK
ncbi:MAG: 50S ribosomal protein L20 [Mycoplasmataceae bacterium]|jgi:large subunit ribosomal protein L20|nr:50S ribosomal protein L20 [Mycoplasmataceae bacterium]